jgi:FKBP-type peptidyl-prolyl cis-trans isomerase FkpA
MRITNLLKIAVVSAIFLLSSCKDEEPSVCPSSPDLTRVDEDQLQKDIEAIDTYLADSAIQATEHPSGLRYRIQDQGDGALPTLCQNVMITYVGQRMSDGEVFDRTEFDNVAIFRLSNLILGWQIGLPLIEEGGTIILYVPSQLGYGKSGASGTIPPNENLIFTIELKSVG